MPAHRPDPGLKTRQIAADLLLSILIQKQALEAAVENHAGYPALMARDRAFVRNLVSTTLRRLGQIDDALASLLERPLPRSAERAVFALRLGACQLLFLGTPAHAAVTTAVALTARHSRPFKGVVNAVLRRLAEQGPDILARQDAEKLNTPEWLWVRWEAAYGPELCRRIAAAHLHEAPLDMSLKDTGEVDAWAERLSARVLPIGSLRRASDGPITLLPGYAEGAWWIQDAAATLPAALLGDVRGRTVIDLCAAPGGKTAQLAAAGAHVIAVERSLARAQRLANNMKRLGLTADIVTDDASRWQPREPVDAVLLDAPCSATGTIRRHPDIPHLKSDDDVAALAATQGRLLEAAAEMVRPNGLLLYAACSIELEEGPAQVSRFLADRPAFVREPIRATEIGGAEELIDRHGDLRSLPCHWHDIGGLDGFFAARLRRIES